MTGHYKETLWLFYITFSGPVKRSQRHESYSKLDVTFSYMDWLRVLPSLNSLLNILPLILKITAFVLFAFILICHFLTWQFNRSTHLCTPFSDSESRISYSHLHIVNHWFCILPWSRDHKWSQIDQQCHL